MRFSRPSLIAPRRPGLPVESRAGRSRTSWVVWVGMLLGGLLSGALPGNAETAGLLHYQGRFFSGTTAFDGTGLFKFALVNGDASVVYWRNAADADADGVPDVSVSLPVSRGLCSVDLGDPLVANMAPIPSAFFGANVLGLTNAMLFLRVWFNDGIRGFERLIPDQRLSAVPFALAAIHASSAATVSDGSITPAKFAAGALQASNVVGVLTPAQLPAAVATTNQIAALQAQVDSMKAQLASSLQSSTRPDDAELMGLGYARIGNFPAPGWRNGTSTGELNGRYGHAAVGLFAGRRMLVWGGRLAGSTFSGSGALYGVDDDAWKAIPTVGAPGARSGHAMVAYGAARALIWGGFGPSGFLNTGARFDAAENSWEPCSLLDAPTGRDAHVATWVDPFLFIWGGRNSNGPLGDGALYDPKEDSWTPLVLAGAPAARFGSTAVPGGAGRVLVWGGRGTAGALGSGAQLVFRLSPAVAPSEWRSFSSVNAPAARFGHTAVWTGSRMIVWGGTSGTPLFGDGAEYDPVADSWTSLPSVGAPTARKGHVAVWTGSEMVVVGGETAAGPVADGSAYDPVTRRWRPLANGGNPVARSGASGIWTGTELIVYGGQSGSSVLAALQRVEPQPTWYVYRKP